MKGLEGIGFFFLREREVEQRKDRISVELDDGAKGVIKIGEEFGIC